MTEPQLTRVVAGCVLEKDGKYLLVQEKKESAYGLWNLPAGRVDIGESFEQAAVREVFEETGYKVEIVAKLQIAHAEPTRPVLHSYKARVLGGELAFPANELLDAQWFTLDEIITLQNENKIRADWVIDSIKAADSTDGAAGLVRTTTYRHTTDKAARFNKHGVDLTIYDYNIPSANVCHVSVKKGHFQEFYNAVSTFTYYIIEGEGTFMLDDEPIEVKATDLVVIPPNTRIHYFGTMEMVLTVSPTWKEENEHHVRFIDENENPYKQK